jgi:competence protein ComEC
VAEVDVRDDIAGAVAIRSDRRRGRRFVRWLAGTFEAELDDGRGALWIPVLFGVGILLYFGLPFEPPLIVAIAVCLALIVLVFLGRSRSWLFRLALLLATVAAGMVAAQLRTMAVASPALTSARTATVRGWIETMERSGQNGARLTIRVVSVEGPSAAQTPERIRLSVRKTEGLAVADGIEVLAALQPRQGPVLPGGYDFGRDAYYGGIGASGFSYGAPKKADLGEPPLSISWRAPLAGLRQAIGARIEAALPGENGRIANALVTGERGGISDESNDVLRDSGLAHILSISGLHMAIVAGVSLWALRSFLALFPPIALRWPIKKWAAAGALLIATLYLGLSGGGVATNRSYIMLAVMLVAVLFDRRAFSVRNVALAAMIVLVLTPESLLSASFQMSFAATLALISGFEAVAAYRRGRRRMPGPQRGPAFWRVPLAWGIGAILTSLLAGLATTPFSAYHFQRTAPLSLFANLAASLPISLLVMPFALLAVLLMPFGLEGPPLQVVDLGLAAVLAIARQVSDWTGSAGLVAKAPLLSLLLITAGLIWLCLWRRAWRLAGIPVMAVGIGLAPFAASPDILIAADGAGAAYRAADGRYRLLGKAGTFETEMWLRADADPRRPRDPALKDTALCDRLGCTALLPSGERIALAADGRAFAEDCRMAAVVISPLAAPAACREATTVIDGEALQRGGAYALYRDGPSFRAVPAIPDPRRPWMPPLAAQ